MSTVDPLICHDERKHACKSIITGDGFGWHCVRCNEIIPHQARQDALIEQERVKEKEAAK